jgi:hypothetical protein
MRSGYTYRGGYTYRAGCTYSEHILQTDTPTHTPTHEISLLQNVTNFVG